MCRHKPIIILVILIFSKHFSKKNFPNNNSVSLNDINLKLEKSVQNCILILSGKSITLCRFVIMTKVINEIPPKTLHVKNFCEVHEYSYFISLC